MSLRGLRSPPMADGNLDGYSLDCFASLAMTISGLILSTKHFDIRF